MGRESQFYFVKILSLGSKNMKIHVLLNMFVLLFLNNFLETNTFHMHLGKHV